MLDGLITGSYMTSGQCLHPSRLISYCDTNNFGNYFFFRDREICTFCSGKGQFWHTQMSFKNRQYLHTQEANYSFLIHFFNLRFCFIRLTQAVRGYLYQGPLYKKPESILTHQQNCQTVVKYICC